jgi:hypothetical protein
MFRGNLSIPYSGVKQSLKTGPACFPETSVNSYQSTMRNIPEERRSPPKILDAIKGQRDLMVKTEQFSACSTHGDLRDGQKMLLESHTEEPI